MTLRFDEQEFEALDNKRHHHKTSFQAIGRDLFLRWLRGPSAVPSPASSLNRRPPDIEALLAWFADPPSETDEAIRNCVRVRLKELKRLSKPKAENG